MALQCPRRLSQVSLSGFQAQHAGLLALGAGPAAQPPCLRVLSCEMGTVTCALTQRMWVVSIFLLLCKYELLPPAALSFLFFYIFFPICDRATQHKSVPQSMCPCSLGLGPHPPLKSEVAGGDFAAMVTSCPSHPTLAITTKSSEPAPPGSMWSLPSRRQ